MKKESKICSKCKDQKPIEYFQKYQRTTMSWCKPCVNKRNKAKWKYIKENKYF